MAAAIVAAAECTIRDPARGAFSKSTIPICMHLTLAIADVLRLATD